MLTERKMFSSSFVSSAASGLESRARCRSPCVELGGALGALGRDPADDLRRRLRRPVGAARVDALRRDGEEEAFAGAQAAASRGSAGGARASCPATSSTRARRAGPRAAPARGCARRSRRSRGRARAGARAASAGRSRIASRLRPPRSRRRVDEPALDERREALAGDVLDVALAAVQRGDDVLDARRRGGRGSPPRRTSRRAERRRSRRRYGNVVDGPSARAARLAATRSAA